MSELRELEVNILAENKRVHAAEGTLFDQLHPEIFNSFEQSLLNRDLQDLAAPPLSQAVDFGCGTGNITLKLLARGLKVTAVDLSQPLLDLLAVRARPLGSACTIVCEDLDTFLAGRKQLPELVTMSSVLHHLPDPWKTLDTICNLLPTGGCLYLTHEPTDCPAPLMVQLLYFCDRVLWNLLHPRLCALGRSIDYSISDYHARKGFGPAAMQTFLAAKGMTINRIRLYGASRFPLLARLTNALGDKRQMTLIARKR